MICAGINGHLEIVIFLCEKGANIESKDYQLKTALHWAAQSGHLPIVEFLTEQNALLEEKDSNGMTALHLATKHCSLNIVEYLAGKNVNLNFKDHCDLTPLDYASDGETINFLTKMGLDFTLSNDTLSQVLENDKYEVFEHLIQSKGLNIEERNAEGQTFLHCAIKYCSGMIVNRLVENEAIVNVRDNHGKTPLHYVSREKVSISPTFYVQHFNTKVILPAFF
jgi:ankyrin repeat protein